MNAKRLGGAAAALVLAAVLLAPAWPASSALAVPSPIKSSTSVSVDAAPLAATPSAAVSCPVSETAQHAVSVTVEHAAGEASVTWSRTKDGVSDSAFGATGASCPLADIDAAGSYKYTARVVDAWGRIASADVSVEVSSDAPLDDYVAASPVDPVTGVGVKGTLHRDARLVARPVAAEEAAFQKLQAAAAGSEVVAAWSVQLVDVPAGAAAFRGTLELSLPATAASAASVMTLSLSAGVPAEVLLLPEAGGNPVRLTGTRIQDVVSMRTDSLGSFAVLRPASSTFTVHASAGTGGRVEPAGDVVLAAGASQAFSFYPEDGWELAAVELDGVSVEVSGNAFRIEGIDADHVLAAAFSPVVPDPALAHVLRTSAGPGGRVEPDTGSDGIQVTHGSPVEVRFVPDDGFRLVSVIANGEAVSVEDGVFRIAAMTDDVAVRGEFERLPDAGPSAATALPGGGTDKGLLASTGDGAMPFTLACAAPIVLAFALAAASRRASGRVRTARGLHGRA